MIPWICSKKHKEYISEAAGPHSIAFKLTLRWHRGSSNPAEPTMRVSSKTNGIYDQLNEISGNYIYGICYQQYGIWLCPTMGDAPKSQGKWWSTINHQIWGYDTLFSAKPCWLFGRNLWNTQSQHHPNAHAFAVGTIWICIKLRSHQTGSLNPNL